ncbi:hypothetical protein EH221_00140 [bacterium]|nr:MAG: hypothetical protein EH221_00140 [bacterium]
MVGIAVYTGDGVTIKRSTILKPGDAIIGHAPIQAHLIWNEKIGAKRTTFTYLGLQIFEKREKEDMKKIKSSAKEKNLEKVSFENHVMLVS